MSTPWYDGTPEFNKERRIVETPPRRSVDADFEAQSNLPNAEALFDSLARIGNKAKRLADATEKAAPPWIDVPDQDSHVRRAVRRKDATVQDGNRITFDLFKDTIEHFERQKEAIKIEDFDDLTGNDVSDDLRIKGKTSKSEHPDLDDNQLGLYVSELMIIWTLHQLMGPWRAQSTSMAVSGKWPPATELGSVLSDTLIGLTMQLLIYGLEEKTLKSFLTQSGSYSSESIDTVIERAKAEVPTEMQKLAARKMGEGDYELILKYSLDFIGRTEKTGYEMWLGYYESRHIRSEAMMSWRAAPHYSEKHANQLNFGSHTATRGGGHNPAIEAAIADSIVPANSQYLCELHNQTTRLDQGLNTIAQVLSSHLGQDTLCCIGLFLEKKDVEWIRKVNQLLKIFLMSQRPILQVDFGRLAANFISIINQRVKQELVHLIQKVSRKIGDPILESLEIHSDKEWNQLFACPLVKHMIDMILAAIDHLVIVLVDLIPDISLSWDLTFGSSMQQRWYVLNTRRKLQALLGTFSQVIQALDSGLLCAEDGGVYTDETIDTFTKGVPDLPHIKLSPDDISKYFGDTKPIEVPDGVPGAVRDTIPQMGQSTIRTGPIDGVKDGEDPSSVKRCREVFEALLKEMEG